MGKIREQKALPIRVKPYEHQVAAYEFALKTYENHKGVAFLMEMGTGKTLTTIAVTGTLAEQGKIKKVLIVAPKTIVSIWEEEFCNFGDYNYSLTALDETINRKADTLRNMKGGIFFRSP